MQRLTTKTPSHDMLEVAIVAMNVALHGMPKLDLLPEGYAVLKDYRQSDPCQPPEVVASSDAATDQVDASGEPEADLSASSDTFDQDGAEDGAAP